MIDSISIVLCSLLGQDSVLWLSQAVSRQLFFISNLIIQINLCFFYVLKMLLSIAVGHKVFYVSIML